MYAVEWTCLPEDWLVSYANGGPWHVFLLTLAPPLLVLLWSMWRLFAALRAMRPMQV